MPGVRRRDVAPLIALTIVSTVGTCLAPVLRSEGLLLAMLSPRLLFLGFAADQVSVVPFVLLATFRLCLADPWHYRLGRAHGPALVARLGRLGRLLDRWAGRRTAVLGLVALRPIGRHLMWAGTQQVSPVAIAATDVVSTALFCIAVKTGVELLPH